MDGTQAVCSIRHPFTGPAVEGFVLGEAARVGGRRAVNSEENANQRGDEAGQCRDGGVGSQQLDAGVRLEIYGLVCLSSQCKSIEHTDGMRAMTT